MNNEYKATLFNLASSIYKKDYSSFPLIFNEDITYSDCFSNEIKGIKNITSLLSSYFNATCKNYSIEVLQYTDDGFSRVQGYGDFAFLIGMAGGNFSNEAGQIFIWLPLCLKSCFNNNKISELTFICDRLICPVVK